MKLFDDQIALVNSVEASMKRGCKRVLVRAETGSGKCLGKDTPVLLYNGTTKLVQNIVVGDKLMGPDSLPRFVKSICHGKENLYKILPKGSFEPFVCNESHILSLVQTKISDYRGGNNYINISIKDYLQTHKTFKHLHKLWRPNLINFKNNNKLELPPYFLGYWLGDGNSRLAAITNADDEIILDFYKVCQDHFLFVRKESAGGIANTYNSTNFKKNQKNKLFDKLKSLNLIKNKHIPHKYLTASKESRLDLLAGLIDSDGHQANNCYDFISKNKNLADGVVFLSRSLGLSAKSVACKKSHDGGTTVGNYYRVSISGNTDIIPCRIKRKKCSPRKQKKLCTRAGFSVEPLGVGDYFGFEIDGPDRLFLLGDFTVTHNTIMAASILHRAREKRSTTWFVVPRKQLLRQTAMTYEFFNLPHSYIASGMKYDAFANNYICSLQSLPRRLPDLKPPRLAVCDEAHYDHGYDKLFDWFKQHGTYVIGLSATPMLANGDGMDKWYQDMVSGLDLRQLIDLGRLSDYRYFEANAPDKSLLKARKKGDYTSESIAEWADVHGKYIVGNAIELYKEHANGKLAIHFSPSIVESKKAADQYNAAGIPAVHIDGETPDDARTWVINKYANREFLVICNVDLMTFGFDLAAQVGRDVMIEAMIDGGPTKSLTRQRQKWGRALRRKLEPAIIFDLVGNQDLHNYPCTEIDWSLDGKERKVRKESEREVKMRQCTNCPRCHPPAPECPHCGWVYPIQSREIENVDGEVKEVDKEAIRAEAKSKRMEVGMAKTVDDLWKIARQSGYKSGWVFRMKQIKGLK